MEITQRTKELAAAGILFAGAWLAVRKKRKNGGLNDKIEPDGKKFKNVKKSKAKMPEFLADTNENIPGLADDFPGLINNAGEPADAGRLQKYWDEHKVSLSKLTQAPAFDKEVQLNSRRFIEYFGFKGVEFGNWMNQEERAQFLFAAAGAFKTLADMLGLPYKYMGLNKTLTIALGARGKGGKVMAHYERNRKAINITKPHGSGGSLLHEYAHALDNAIGTKSNYADMITADPKNSQTTTTALIVEKINNGGWAAFAEKLFAGLYWDGNQQTQFAKNIEDSNSDYIARRVEVFARSCEVWASQLSKSKNNSMFIKSSYDIPSKYPSFALIDKLMPIFTDFFKLGIKYVNGESVTVPKFDFSQSNKNATEKPKGDSKTNTKTVKSIKIKPVAKSKPIAKPEIIKTPAPMSKEEKARAEMEELKQLIKKAIG